MPQHTQDDDREHRIARQVFIDVYEEAEAALSWYYYLQHRLQFPFKAHWIKNRHQESLTAREVVEVVGLSAEAECEQEMLINIRYREGDLEDEFAVALDHIMPIDADAATQEAIADWHYWVDMNHGSGGAAV